MGQYILRIFDPNAKIARMIEADYPDALDALDTARSLAVNGPVEVWNDWGKIAHVKTGDAPSTADDPLPG